MSQPTNVIITGYGINNEPVTVVAGKAIVVPGTPLNIYTKTEVDNLLVTKEDDLGLPDVSGYVLTSTDTGVRTWVAQSGGGGGTGGVSTYVELTDGTSVDLPLINTPLSTALGLKADQSTTYTKTETDGLVNAKEDDLGNPSVSGRVLTSTTSGVRSWITIPSGVTTFAALTDSTSVDLPTINIPLLNALGLKADQSTTYTKVETDNLVNPKADQSTTYTKVETDNLVNPKADQSTTYTKTEVEGLVNVKEDDLGNPLTNGDVLVSQTDGTRSWVTIPDGITTYDELSDKATVDLPVINTPLSTALGLKADQSTTYTKVETDDLVNPKADKIKTVKLIEASPYTLLDTDGDKILECYLDTPVTITVPSGLKVLGRYEGKQLGDGEITFSGDIMISDEVELISGGKPSVWGLDRLSNGEYCLYGNLKLKE